MPQIGFQSSVAAQLVGRWRVYNHCKSPVKSNNTSLWLDGTTALCVCASTHVVCALTQEDARRIRGGVVVAWAAHCVQHFRACYQRACVSYAVHFTALFCVCVCVEQQQEYFQSPGGNE